jgi:hypothetical protein
MDTRRSSRSEDEFGGDAEVGTEWVPFDRVELVELRYAVSVRGRSGIGSILPAILLLAMLLTIATLAIATSAGWDIVIGA